ncbi:hypothetical protein B1J94_14360 [Leptospira kirschneri serovar Grippotyphosa]|nr:hypothetical protein B1J94_14360 [Leptospira kirschneri serovar Grippotyphosa]
MQNKLKNFELYFDFIKRKTQIKLNVITHNYIIKYLIFYIESAFCDRINGTQFLEISKNNTIPESNDC